LLAELLFPPKVRDFLTYIVDKKISDTNAAFLRITINERAYFDGCINGRMFNSIKSNNPDIS